MNLHAEFVNEHPPSGLDRFRVGAGWLDCGAERLGDNQPGITWPNHNNSDSGNRRANTGNVLQFKNVFFGKFKRQWQRSGAA